MNFDQICVGANDLESIMIVEGVVSASETSIKLSSYDMIRATAGVGFQPRFLALNYAIIDFPLVIEKFIV